MKHQRVVFSIEICASVPTFNLQENHSQAFRQESGKVAWLDEKGHDKACQGGNAGEGARMGRWDLGAEARP